MKKILLRLRKTNKNGTLFEVDKCKEGYCIMRYDENAIARFEAQEYPFGCLRFDSPIKAYAYLKKNIENIY